MHWPLSTGCTDSHRCWETANGASALPVLAAGCSIRCDDSGWRSFEQVLPCGLISPRTRVAPLTSCRHHHDGHSVFQVHITQIFLNEWRVSRAAFFASHAAFIVWNALNDPLFAFLQVWRVRRAACVVPGFECPAV